MQSTVMHSKGCATECQSHTHTHTHTQTQAYTHSPCLTPQGIKHTNRRIHMLGARHTHTPSSTSNGVPHTLHHHPSLITGGHRDTQTPIKGTPSHHTHHITKTT